MILGSSLVKLNLVESLDHNLGSELAISHLK